MVACGFLCNGQLQQMATRYPGQLHSRMLNHTMINGIRSHRAKWYWKASFILTNLKIILISLTTWLEKIKENKHFTEKETQSCGKAKRSGNIVNQKYQGWKHYTLSSCEPCYFQIIIFTRCCHPSLTGGFKCITFKRAKAEFSTNSETSRLTKWKSLSLARYENLGRGSMFREHSFAAE